MQPFVESSIHGQLVDRRGRLEAALPGGGDRLYLQGLLHEVDAALGRLEAGTFGTCQECHGRVEADRLACDPLIRVCLECLTEGQRRALERDLATASRVQAALLPRRDLAAGGWEVHYRYDPAGPVSGDYFDVVLPASPEEPLHFVFGDVSGKGVSASILMAELKALFRALLGDHLPLAEIVGQANRMFVEATLPSHFATAISGRLSPSGEVELVNAGHNPALVVGGSGVRTLAADGLPLGLFADGRYGSARLRLEPGESLLLYTDGLTEARSPAGEELGIGRVVELAAARAGASARALVEACAEGLAAFCGDAPRTDDLTIVAVRRQEALTA